MTDPALRRAAALVYVADLASPVLDADDEHHLSRVLRLRDGEPVAASDGRGGWRPCRWAGGRVEPEGDIAREAPAPVAVTIALAVPKGERADWAVQKLTEAGADRIVPLLTERGAVRWAADKHDRVVDRWRRISRQAGMQSRRLWLPAIDPPATPAAALAAGPGAVAAEPGGAPPSLSTPTVLVGPEGGWAAGELPAGTPTVGLGPHVLRTETAAVATAVLLIALRSGIVREA